MEIEEYKLTDELIFNGTAEINLNPIFCDSELLILHVNIRSIKRNILKIDQTFLKHNQTFKT